MTPAETRDLMALIAEEHPKFLETANPLSRSKLWWEALQHIPFGIGEHAVKQILAESPYMPKLSDVVQKIKEMSKAIGKPAQNGWPVTDWEIRSMIRLRTSLGMPVPPEYVRLAKQRGIPLPADAIAGKAVAVRLIERA